MKKSGFIFLYTLCLSLLALFIGAYIFTRGIFFPPYTRLVHDRTRARQLALAGIEWTRGFLAVPKKEKKEEKPMVEPAEERSPDVEDILLLVPIINQWQSFELREESDGIDATIRLCIVSEEGKLNLNSIWNFKEKKFLQLPTKNSLEKIIQKFGEKIDSITRTSGFKTALERFFKQRKNPIEDLTELLEDEYFKKSFQDFIFYEPHTDSSINTQRLFLTDLFTIYPAEPTLNLWLLSHSVCTILGLQSAESQAKKEREQRLQQVVKTIKPRFLWPKDWNSYLEPLYRGKFPFEQFPEIGKSAFKPVVFSVVCEAKVAGVVERIYAILERRKRSQNDQIMYDVTVLRVYIL